MNTETHTEDDRDFLEERAAIAEHEGGLSKEEAEELALKRLKAKYNRRGRTFAASVTK